MVKNSMTEFVWDGLKIQTDCDSVADVFFRENYYKNCIKDIIYKYIQQFQIAGYPVNHEFLQNYREVGLIIIEYISSIVALVTLENKTNKMRFYIPTCIFQDLNEEDFYLLVKEWESYMVKMNNMR